MKIVFSRKGFDSKLGCVASPIVRGTPHSLPIPTHTRSAITYAQVCSPACNLLGQLNARGPDGPLLPTTLCHLDPDICETHLPRLPGWRGALGQDKQSASLLRNQGIKHGDLFLFFGWFDEYDITINRYASNNEHRVYGWLQVDEIIDMRGQGHSILQRYPWLKDHPHVNGNWNHHNLRHDLYIAKRNLDIHGLEHCLDVSIPGYGVLKQGYRLSVTGQPRRDLWATPDWLNPLHGGSGLSGKPANRWTNNTVDMYGSGQEFVTDIEFNTAGAIEWLSANIFNATNL